MSKILILGDIHGRTCWADIIEKENPDKVIFLGDYVSTHEGFSEDQQCSNLEDILNYKEANPNKVILLRGNHDIQHLGYSWAECSGYFRSVGRYMMSIKDRFLSDTQWVYVEGNIIFSHAGVSKTWFKNFDFEDVNLINNCEPSEKFGFIPNRLSDYYGDSITQPCVWIRPSSLASDALDGYIQVVGHTPAKRLTNLKSVKEEWPEIWLCDRLPDEYLIIEDEVFIPKVFKDSLED